MHMKSVKAVLDRLASVLGTTSGNQLAEALGVSPQAVSSWKSRESVPYAQCVEVAEQHGISLDWLLTGVGSMSRDMATPNLVREESVAPYGMDPKERAILELFRELDEGDQREIQSAAEEKKRLSSLEQRLAELEAVVADIKRLA